MSQSLEVNVRPIQIQCIGRQTDSVDRSVLFPVYAIYTHIYRYLSIISVKEWKEFWLLRHSRLSQLKSYHWLCRTSQTKANQSCDVNISYTCSALLSSIFSTPILSGSRYSFGKNRVYYTIGRCFSVIYAHETVWLIMIMRSQFTEDQPWFSSGCLQRVTSCRRSTLSCYNAR